MEFNREKNRTQTFPVSNANLYTADDLGNTPLHIAASRGDLNRVKMLIKVAPNLGEIIEKKNNYGSTPLHYATWYGQLLIVKYLVDYGADLKTKDSQGNTLLHAAAWNGDLKLVKFFFENGLASFLENKDQNGNTPLLSAARNGHFRVVKWLLSAGADIKVEDNKGNTILFLAVKNNRFNIFEYLVSAKQIDLSVVKDTEESGNNTLLHLVALRNHVSPGEGDIRLPQYLVKQGANIEAKNSNGDTPLHIAVENAHIKLTQYLVKQGANIEAKNSNGDTPLHIAVEYEHINLIQYLIQRGANINAKNNDESTPLHLAIKNDCNAVIDLIKKGANTKEIGDNNHAQSLFKQDIDIEHGSNEDKMRIYEVYQEKPEELGNYTLEQKGALVEDNHWNDSLLKASPSQESKEQRHKKMRHPASKPQATMLNNPFDMVGFNESLPSLGNTSEFFAHNYSSEVEINPFNLSSTPERGLNDNLETNNSNVSEAFLLASTLFNTARKKHSTTLEGNDERLDQQTKIIDAIDTFDPNVTATKPFN